MDDSQAYQIGFEHGKERGSWVIDGNTTTETARAILEGIDNGDPEIMDMEPAPLSGEWAGESIPELSDRLGLNLEDDNVASEFETGYSVGFWHEVTRAANYITEES